MDIKAILEGKLNKLMTVGSFDLAITGVFGVELRLRRRFRLDALRRRSRRAKLNLFLCGKILILKLIPLPKNRRADRSHKGRVPIGLHRALPAA